MRARVARLLRRAGLAAARCADRLDPHPAFGGPYATCSQCGTSYVDAHVCVGKWNQVTVTKTAATNEPTWRLWVNGRPA